MRVKRAKHMPHRFLDAFNRNRSLFVIRGFIIVTALFLLVTQRTFWTPDTLFVVLLIIFASFGQARSFIVRFFPLVSLLLLYELFRGIADDLSGAVHVTEMIEFDRWLFMGSLPTVVLQEWWWHGEVRWYDFYYYALYMAHFLMPILLAVIIWKRAKQYYWQFMWALVALSFAAFVTYILYPAAPPWMAFRDGYIPEDLVRVSSDVWWAMGVDNFSEVYAQLPANEVAAVPSLHSAYPLLFSMFVAGIFGVKKYWWVYVYPVSMWVGVVYLGEHYVVDVILGALYAALAYHASVWGYRWYYKPNSPLRLKMEKLTKKLNLKNV